MIGRCFTLPVTEWLTVLCVWLCVGVGVGVGVFSIVHKGIRASRTIGAQYVSAR